MKLADPRWTVVNDATNEPLAWCYHRENAEVEARYKSRTLGIETRIRAFDLADYFITGKSKRRSR
jgi:hypothetical protein